MGKIWGWIRRDGLLHMETCALLSVAFGLFLPWWGAGAIALLSGLVKEAWDTKHGVATWHDVVCDLIGTLVGVAIILLNC